MVVLGTVFKKRLLDFIHAEQIMEDFNVWITTPSEVFGSDWHFARMHDEAAKEKQ